MSRDFYRFPVLFFLVIFACSCSVRHAKDGTYVTIRRGDSLWSLSQKYNVSVQNIIDKNRIKNPKQLKVGQKILIPRKSEASKGVSIASAKGTSIPVKRSSKYIRASGLYPNKDYESQPANISGLIWPLKKGSFWLSSKFGMRDGRMHKGIDLAAPIGTPVYAASDGSVTYVGEEGEISGYGRIIFLLHDNGVRTVYAHLDKQIVKEGQKVKKGEQIGNVGNTGRARGPHLHFEVRRFDQKTGRVIAFDPLKYLLD